MCGHAPARDILRLSGALAMAITLAACTALEGSGPPAVDAPTGSAPAPVGPPTLRALRNATYFGIGQLPAVRLEAGYWEGAPYVEGTATRPRVTFADDFRRTGDLTGDDREEAVVLVRLGAGGTGEFLYLAVFESRAEGPVNIGTVLVGDRVQVLDAHVDREQIRMRVVRAGPEDAACCPGEVAALGWRWLPDEGLAELGVQAPVERLSLEMLGDREWVLVDWTGAEPVVGSAAPTLAHAAGRFAGSGGCNRYFAGVEVGERPGEIRLAEIGTTQMACDEEAMRVEQRFLALLETTVSFGFDVTRLALGYTSQGRYATMLFEPRAPAG